MTIEDELRVKLLIAEARIISLEREITVLQKRIGNGVPKVKATPNQVRFTGKILTPKQLKIFNLSGGTCFYYGCTITHDEFTADHLIPISKGGRKHAIANQVPCCSPCNAKKGNRMPTQAETEFAVYLQNRCRKP